MFVHIFLITKTYTCCWPGIRICGAAGGSCCVTVGPTPWVGSDVICRHMGASAAALGVWLYFVVEAFTGVVPLVASVDNGILDALERK